MQKALAVLTVALLGSSLAAAKTTHHSSKKSSSEGSGKSRSSSAKSGKSKKTSAKGSAPCHSKKCAKVSKKGQQHIEPARATEIQQALAKAGYLNSEPNGQWDAATQAAMTKFQADNGWQTKVTPDSRALIKLGLGPSHEGLINPETAMTGLPPSPEAKQGPDAPQR
jgi:peptidoglycan hydrolase-like protein with peptidoglycan-binding domain